VPNSKPLPSRRRSDRGRGQALVEFALVIPIFLLVLSGIFDFGFLLYSRMTVINSAREGARAGSVAADSTQIPSLVDQRVRSAATGAGLVSTSPTMTITTTCVPTKTPTSCSFATEAGNQSGDSVKVTVDYAYTSLFPLLFGSQIHLLSTVQMVRE
jgi:Flp pilus assembly protein TadG